jgi:hypothetical protein
MGSSTAAQQLRTKLYSYTAMTALSASSTQRREPLGASFTLTVAHIPAFRRSKLSMVCIQVPDTDLKSDSPSSGMLRCVAPVTDVSGKRSASIIRVTRIGELETSATSNPDDGGATLLRNVGSYRSHTVITSQNKGTS